ncbi:MAG: DoxX family protein [Flavobacteriaceae bacterium]|nr:DoxX family protein [Flavobacteriaceae bacterium]
MNLNTTQHLVLALLRISFSAMLMTHGYGKLTRLISGDFQFANPIGIGELPTLVLAILAEFVAPIFIIVGYKTKWATVLPMFTMLTAALIVHLSDPFARKEHGLLFFFGFLTVYAFGAGRFSIDRK